jgi:NAD(P)-dependent dehydrogenase (short-subunit alcohol dehydrogenase family)
MARRSFAGKAVVVTGASAGLGRAVARAFGAARARVALLARTEEGLAQAAEEIHRAGGEVLSFAVDVADARAVDEAADAVAHAWGAIDVWVNDAMVSVFSPVMETSPEEFRRVTEVTYLGTVHGTRAALRHMLPRDAGVVVQIGSALAYRSIPLQSAYCAAKAAIRGFTDSLRCELLHDGSHVRITMLQLPAINTPQFEVVRTRLPRHPKPVPPIYQPEVIARAVLQAARRSPREMWVGWSAAKAILGQMVAPGLLDRYLARVGYSAQQAPWPPEPGRGDDLFSPLPGDKGAHGEFDAEARGRSFSVWLQLRRRPIAIGLGVAALGALGWRTLRSA